MYILTCRLVCYRHFKLNPALLLPVEQTIQRHRFRVAFDVVEIREEILVRDRDPAERRTILDHLTVFRLARACVRLHAVLHSLCIVALIQSIFNTS